MNGPRGLAKIDPPTDPAGCFWYVVSFLVFTAIIMTLFDWLSYPG